jgi:hypothetical protein
MCDGSCLDATTLDLAMETGSPMSSLGRDVSVFFKHKPNTTASDRARSRPFGGHWFGRDAEGQLPQFRSRLPTPTTLLLRFPFSHFPPFFCELQLSQQNSNIILRVDNTGSLLNLWVRDGTVSSGTALQAGRLRVRFLMVLMEFLLAWSFRSHYFPGVDSAANRNEYQEYFVGVKAASAYSW